VENAFISVHQIIMPFHRQKCYKDNATNLLTVSRLRLWPQKRWKQIILVLVIAFVVFFVSFAAFAGLIMSGAINREVVSDIDVVNSGGNKTALIVYQPGYSSLPADVSNAFADGLAANGWRVEVTTASPEAPVDFSKYSLLVLAYPNYGNSVGTAIGKYVDRVNDFNGVNTVILSCGSAATGSVDALKPQLEAKNGVYSDGFGFSTVEEAQQAASGITP
jgi:hypothetical protein